MAYKQLTLVTPAKTTDEHPWGHGADAVSQTQGPGERLDCGHKSRRKGDARLRYNGQWVCRQCALQRCPVCSVAGRNVCLDGTTLDERAAS